MKQRLFFLGLLHLLMIIRSKNLTKYSYGGRSNVFWRIYLNMTF
jgi:hypothetical protein